MISENQIASVTGTTVRDNEGNKIGKAGQVYLDDATGRPAWLTVNTGLFGTSENFVPIEGADLSEDVVTVAYTKDRVKDSPKVDADDHLDAAEEQELYRHYGIPSHDTSVQNTDVPNTNIRDADGLATGDATTGSPHRLDGDTERAQAGQGRLRKYVTTQGQTDTASERLDEEPMAGGDDVSNPVRTETIDLDADTTARSENR